MSCCIMRQYQEAVVFLFDLVYGGSFLAFCCGFGGIYLHVHWLDMATR